MATEKGSPRHRSNVSLADISSARIGTFARSGEYWTISFGDTTFSLRDIKGLAYLQLLLQHPGEEFHAMDLVQGSGGGAPAEKPLADTTLLPDSLSIGGLGDAGAMLDEEAKQEYRRRLRELRAELEELREGGGDHERGEQVEAEIDFIEREIVRAVGLGGRDRRAGSAAERARLSVTRAIKSALHKISEHHTVLGELLEKSIMTGLFSVYAAGSANAVAWRYSLASAEQPREAEAVAPIAPSFAKAPRDAFTAQTAFVGREVESAALWRHLDQVRRGEGGVVLIGGAAGVGKTRIATELGVEAAQ